MYQIKTYVLILLAAVLFWTPAIADSVPEKKAAAAAAAFFGTDEVSLSRPARLAVTDESDSETPAYRAYNREGGGFVVISGNDAVTPVLAYSMEGAFPDEADMPESMAWWFSGLARQIRAIPEGTVADEDVRAMWEQPRNLAPVKLPAPTAIPSTLLLETASWGQDAPYFDNCPTVYGQKSVTGCVATAGAIVARYFCWPDAGTGTVPGYHDSGAGFDSHTLGYSYDWGNMPLSYSGGYSSAEAEAVAVLMYDMGTISKMEYGPDGSGAYPSDLLHGLQTYMKYSSGAYLAYRDFYSDENWISLLKSTLNNCGPIIYGGYTSDYRAGHEFVLDGYDESDRMHFNWGWDGYCNCYCTITNLVPEGTEYDFATEQDAIIGLVPDYSAPSGPDPEPEPEPDPADGYSAAQTAASTALSYDRASAVLMLTCEHPVNWSVKNSHGTVIDSGAATEGSDISIDLSSLVSGTYTIGIGSSDDPFKFTITK